MKQVSLTEFKSQFDDLVKEVFTGEEIEVCDNGHSFKMVPTPQAPQVEARPRKAGSMKGQIWMADDFDAPMDENGYFMDENGNYTK